MRALLLLQAHTSKNVMTRCVREFPSIQARSQAWREKGGGGRTFKITIV